MAVGHGRRNGAKPGTGTTDGVLPERAIPVPPPSQAAAIEDYALIGDCHTAALV
ncbi:MAG: Trehalase-like, N-terminal, partial [Acetobacteraceae bacterium]|nr:Trehalase-like, N-terminal [Acetobacteraceae bacterium]